MRIMALDVGTRRIGVAMSDELMITAQGRDTIYRKELNGDLATIARLVKENGVSEVVVGLPISMNGSYSAKTKEVVSFMETLAKSVDIPVKTWDERLTTVQAQSVLLAADVSRAKRKKVTDKLAAQIILQSYLDSKSKKGVS